MLGFEAVMQVWQTLKVYFSSIVNIIILYTYIVLNFKI
jgi:hypothetical protein